MTKKKKNIYIGHTKQQMMCNISASYVGGLLGVAKVSSIVDVPIQMVDSMTTTTTTKQQRH